MNDNSGYLHPMYVESLSEFGRPRALKHSGGWILERFIPSSEHRDGMGPYPLFCCKEWRGLGDDIAELASELVSLAVVTDPFGSYSAGLLQESFDRVLPFKTHFLAELSQMPEKFVSRSHIRLANRALRDVEVDRCSDADDLLEDWVTLFDVLVRRHRITGVRAFSRAAFAKQLKVPGLVAFRARHRGETVGLDLWYVQDDVAQGHLVALNDLGYRLHAAYATKWELLHYFYGKVRCVNFGGLPGTNAGNGTGLAHFKGGWSNATRTSYFCGRVLDCRAYRLLTERAGNEGSGYFPSYRQGEF